MHVLIATDGSRQSLAAARKLKSFADPTKVTDVSIVAVIRPLAAVAFADELSGTEQRSVDSEMGSFRESAQRALDVVAGEFDGWGPRVHKRLRSGSPANEIIKAAKQLDAGLLVVAAGGRGITDTVRVGSTAQRVQHYAPCPVLVVRPPQRKRRLATRKRG
ncbi:universal stress protein [Nocardioides mesophilus]|uniref:Universal stress protein n=1 Tax=Nocardioides mesophilus TaxID=433659 RepID=A0A7G9R7D3_9ACTN|nr:universal stress protein [Nocardioides mesophilus]QNN51508.1 universal stress protein [Nocardioides mesophilus]